MPDSATACAPRLPTPAKPRHSRLRASAMRSRSSPGATAATSSSACETARLRVGATATGGNSAPASPATSSRRRRRSLSRASKRTGSGATSHSPGRKTARSGSGVKSPARRGCSVRKGNSAYPQRCRWRSSCHSEDLRGVDLLATAHETDDHGPTLMSVQIRDEELGLQEDRPGHSVQGPLQDLDLLVPGISLQLVERKGVRRGECPEH